MISLRPRFVLAAIALAASVLSAPVTAMAADYSAPPPPEPELRRSDWTGPYLGGIGTIGCMETHYIPSSGPDPDLSGCGYMGGVVAGFNYQIDRWVLGVEGDYSWGGKTSHNLLDAVDYKIDGLGTIRGRVGWLATDETLFYATGGVGWLTGTIDALVGPNSDPESDKRTHFGWLVGGGIEHAFTPNIHARLEYLFGSFNKKVYDLTVPGVCGTPCFADLDFEELHMVRLGVTWNFTGLFDTPEPVADAPVYKP